MYYPQLVRPRSSVHLLASLDFAAMAPVVAVAVEQFVVDLAVGGPAAAINIFNM